MERNIEVDQFIDRETRWKKEMSLLRSILLTTTLEEEIKWRQPCYSYKNGNVAILGSFKNYCALSFFKGALLQDEHNILVKAGENTQAARVLKFTNCEQINNLSNVLREYLFEAIEVEKAGLKVETKSNERTTIIPELQEVFDRTPSFETAFKQLTPGRQRAYIMFFDGAKQQKTKISRIEKYIPRILDGKGINDCTCGLSKRMPNCDGSHKQL